MSLCEPDEGVADVGEESVADIARVAWQNENEQRRVGGGIEARCVLNFVFATSYL